MDATYPHYSFPETSASEEDVLPCDDTAEAFLAYTPDLVPNDPIDDLLGFDDMSYLNYLHEPIMGRASLDAHFDSSSSLDSHYLDDLWPSSDMSGYVSLSDVNAYVAEADSKHVLRSRSPSSDDGDSSDASSIQQKYFNPPFGDWQFPNVKKRISAPHLSQIQRIQSPSRSVSISTYLSRQRLSDDEDNNADDYEFDDELDNENHHNGFQQQHKQEQQQQHHHQSIAVNAVTTSKKRQSLDKRQCLDKGRNVDRACNHCKRSHLRCDNMRPCRRCIVTGKVGCKDVEHKPRGRPRLNKTQL
ncbi:hypothetical protein DFQ28_011374 [Apophysomyces sp. BC1034]|nr:hypothetical protein DFQ30_010671 [Apophysomyces sp. BC1015]KAG0170073.1 hypothetical protein DFQ29_009442 [Apophysomyces sp. BC1021]KAG0184327.1 hypothetical protein DFQ28_011374 [Apophysomyces sp. BC1034]